MKTAVDSQEGAVRRLPGRKLKPEHREELLRIWGHVDDDGRKMMLFFARQLAREQGLVPADTPLVITDRVF
ncbi:hypothetical protein [Sediminicoccus rosea]|uniref:Uncharacterized protein n=1 Tax=Sediminicoccus rosea TaxID=1225128 RepID=A0ABZ0PDL2_9PROT|nr:hypothetical protein [Sediminicoccus rosea]WPB83720.1 hypothetical protein R9Z33_16585 [Sediminicoccus rosea]